jgi:hypothetical protein
VAQDVGPKFKPQYQKNPKLQLNKTKALEEREEPKLENAYN